VALDKNHRHFWLTVTEIEGNVIAEASNDMVTIEFAGKVPPSVRERFTKALLDGDFELIEKRLV
jgi:hypothetical protein